MTPFLGGSREKRAVNLLGPSVIRIASANHPTMACSKDPSIRHVSPQIDVK